MDVPITAFTLAGAVLDELRHPLLAVDAKRTIHLRNRHAAEALARAGHLAEIAGRLVGTDPATDAGVEAALAELSTSRRERWTLRLGTDGAHSAAAGVVTRMSRPGAPDLAVIALFPACRDGEAALAAMFDLTPAEARVAGCIAKGWSPKQIAHEHGVSTSTVRSQVSSLFEKTGAHRQADLMRLMVLATGL